ncbi:MULTISPECIES: DUF192 domain-containing protein [Thalassospira]|uniref:DUF192 domain-containing protein n=2 Tax=Thalassospira lucentensis TaxID=168935 RepID=A0A358HQJ9_9PROT|nr:MULTISPECIES: DUF192 domain-containing protein [Thalassospira]HBU97455.1 DUF192 domain-containing protein [Thalassospira lucentensis]|tara:strand:- start:339905 stop:340351 length:447 start_codon:yes stop_codon:yes gene_type:complete
MKSLFQMVLVVCFVSAAVVAGLNAKATGFERSRILVDGEVFNVEMAITPDERSRGLMYRTEMANNAGMLFDFGRAADISMWMKNTFISLDMLFIDAKGTIVGIEKRTVPQSEAIILGPKPVRFVLELNGGASDRMGFEVGEKVEGLPR